MNQSNERLRLTTTLGAGPGGLAVAVEGALQAVAGAPPEVSPTSLSLDYGAEARPGETLLLEAWIDRAARTLVFAQAQARRARDGAIVAVASGVFRRAE